MAITAVFFLLLLLRTEIRARVILEEEIEDYYWKEYDGTIPEAALSAGGVKPVYIGQAFYDDETLVPGEIDADKKTLFYTMNNKQQTAIRNIKILCVRNPNHYEWIDTNSTNIRFLTMKQLVPGGFLNEIPFLIGRTFWNETVVVGKIYMDLSDDTFAFNANGEAHYNNVNYQVLSYNPRLIVKHDCKQFKTEFEGSSNIYNIYFN